MKSQSRNEALGKKIGKVLLIIGCISFLIAIILVPFTFAIAGNGGPDESVFFTFLVTGILLAIIGGVLQL